MPGMHSMPGINTRKQSRISFLARGSRSSFRSTGLSTVGLPLFPCYVFFKGGLSRQLDILTTPGVHSVVASAGSVADIPEEEINAVRKMVEGSSTRLEPHPFIKFGDYVRVKSGPLMGLEGILIRKKNQFRLVVSVEILGRSAAAEVDVSTVERVSSGNAPATWRQGPAHIPACA